MAALQLFTKSNNKYYNIDTILMEQEAVPCEFLTDVIKLGHWDPSSHSPNLAKQTRVEAPLWMAESLVVRQIATTKSAKSEHTHTQSHAFTRVHTHTCHTTALFGSENETRTPNNVLTIFRKTKLFGFMLHQKLSMPD